MAKTKTKIKSKKHGIDIDIVIKNENNQNSKNKNIDPEPEIGIESNRRIPNYFNNNIEIPKQEPQSNFQLIRPNYNEMRNYAPSEDIAEPEIVPKPESEYIPMMGAASSIPPVNILTDDKLKRVKNILKNIIKTRNIGVRDVDFRKYKNPSIREIMIDVYMRNIQLLTEEVNLAGENPDVVYAELVYEELEKDDQKLERTFIR